MHKLYFVIYFQKINGALEATCHLLHRYHLCFMLFATSPLQFLSTSATFSYPNSTRQGLRCEATLFIWLEIIQIYHDKHTNNNIVFYFSYHVPYSNFINFKFILPYNLYLPTHVNFISTLAYNLIGYDLVVDKALCYAYIKYSYWRERLNDLLVISTIMRSKYVQIDLTGQHQHQAAQHSL